MTPTATTTQILSLVNGFVGDNGPQVLLILIGVFSALFIFVLGKKGIKKVWRALRGL